MGEGSGFFLEPGSQIVAAAEGSGNEEPLEIMELDLNIAPDEAFSEQSQAPSFRHEDHAIKVEQMPFRPLPTCEEELSEDQRDSGDEVKNENNGQEKIGTGRVNDGDIGGPRPESLACNGICPGASSQPERFQGANDVSMQVEAPKPTASPAFGQVTDSSTDFSLFPEEDVDSSNSEGSVEDDEAPGQGNSYQYWAEKLERECATRTGHAKPPGGTYGCAVCTSGRGARRAFPHLDALVRHAETTTSGARAAAHVAYARALNELKARLSGEKPGKQLARLSGPEKIVKPPIVIAQNLRTKFDEERKQWNGVSGKVLGASLRAKGYDVKDRNVKDLWNAGGHRGTAFILFEATERGLLCAKQLAESQEQRGRGRVAWEHARAAGARPREEDGSPLAFCYLATADDMRALDPRAKSTGWEEIELQTLLKNSVRERDQRQELELRHAKAQSELRAAEGKNRELEGEKMDLARQNEALRGEVEAIRAATEAENQAHAQEMLRQVEELQGALAEEALEAKAAADADRADMSRRLRELQPGGQESKIDEAGDFDSAHEQLSKIVEDSFQKLDIAYNDQEVASFVSLRSAFDQTRVQMRRVREENRRAVMREFEQKLREVAEQAVRARAESERLREERNELDNRRNQQGAPECIVCSEEWSDSVKRFQFDCGHAVICEKCCEKYIATEEAKMGKTRGRKQHKLMCPMGTCDLRKNKRFKPAYLG
ncbi:XS domain-containing protein [Klebsormidium nitens]|uniref:XS domain-containing protein n=1 Tax=Klebsormidium nitens TaxID=105231 RepID=A0A1Y1HQ88_KLENI|nr:XS domain-containing protein [Klebsormidium nitens]|eukprot:GAQ79151.1 XS domain-containing protein [Klebsormidium nitens]